MRKRAKISISAQKRRTARHAGVFAAGVLLLVCAAAGQEEMPAQTDSGTAQDAAPAAANTTHVTVRGHVRNALTGAGIARVLVLIEGDAATGTLTDGDGRFEFASVPSGPQAFTLAKPGYLDGARENAAVDGSLFGNARNTVTHNVVVAEGMPALSFALTPAATIRGMALLPSGEPAPGITIYLAQRTIEGGRAVWQLSTQTSTRSDGSFRFGGLSAGTYTLYSQPHIEGDASGEAEISQPVETPGYPVVYYPDAREPGSAGRIAVTAGAEAQIALTLAEENFHRVTVAITGVAGVRQTGHGTVEIQDQAGRALPYTARYNAARQQVETMLPDGNYRMLVSMLSTDARPRQEQNESAAGMIEIAVAGKPVGPLRAKIAPQLPPPIEVSLLRGGNAPAGEGRNNLIAVLANPALGWLDGGMTRLFANGPVAGPLAAVATPPGAYWLHAQIARKGLCEGSFTTGGANMAREPLHVGAGGATAPMQLSVRRDCAQLTLHLPPAAMAFESGEEPFYTAYAVPDFDFTREPDVITLRPTSGGSATLIGLTPGNYHVYLFAGEHRLEYRNPEVLASFASQTVTLEPNGTNELVLEMPQR